MRTCKYCNNDFRPRPQVKNPKACLSAICQKKRQRDNEKAWKIRHLKEYDRHYYSDQKQKRILLLKNKSAEFFNALTAGFRFLKIEISEVPLKHYWDLFFMGLGIRVVNKLWVD
jgi:hypothetical protein